MPRGGRRAGAGRPKKYTQREMFHAAKPSQPEAAATQYSSAAEYLDAVARGLEPPDPARIAAAKALLPYEKPKTRVPLAAEGTPRSMQRAADTETENNRVIDWEKRSAEIRNKFVNSEN